MAKHEIKLPAMGEGIIEATITRWLVDEGSFINVDDTLVEVATDKVDSEIPSPFSGILSKIMYREGEIPKVGEVIAVISSENQNTTEDEIVKQEVGPEEIIHNIESEETTINQVESQGPGNISEKIMSGYISPLVRNLAKQRGISFDELLTIHGTGKEDRITKEDIQNYILNGRQGKHSKKLHNHEPASGKGINIFSHEKSIPSSPAGETDIIEMDRIRKLIADNMLKSKRTAPHVTSFAEVDVTDMVTWREKIKSDFLKSEGVNLTYTALFTEIVALTLKEYPKINASVDGDKILIKKEINIGIATALQNGNLVVPVIKNTDTENIRGLAHKIYDLAERARQSRLQPAEIKGGTFTITNIGQYNSLTGTPIINLPEVAILAIGTIKKKPWVVKTPEGYGIAIRDIVMLSLTYDHRIIDGALGGEFLNRISYYLEHFNPGKTW